jgi:hypothetical protein
MQIMSVILEVGRYLAPDVRTLRDCVLAASLPSAACTSLRVKWQRQKVTVASVAAFSASKCCMDRCCMHGIGSCPQIARACTERWQTVSLPPDSAHLIYDCPL